MSLLTVKQAAERAGVSESLIYQWCDERRLVHYRVGGAGKRGKILIDPADVDAFMASLKVEARASLVVDHNQGIASFFCDKKAVFSIFILLARASCP